MATQQEKVLKGSKKARRKSARLAAVQCLYQIDQSEGDREEIIEDYLINRRGVEVDGEILVAADPDLLKEIIRTASAQKEDLDPVITGNLSDNQSVETLDLLMYSILLSGASELRNNTTDDKGIIINDYIEVAKAFYDGNEYKLVNVVLDKISKILQ